MQEGQLRALEQSEAIIDFAEKKILEKDVLQADDVKKFLESKLEAKALYGNFSGGAKESASILKGALNNWETDRSWCLLNLLGSLQTLPHIRMQGLEVDQTAAAEVKCAIWLIDNPLIPSINIQEYSRLQESRQRWAKEESAGDELKVLNLGVLINTAQFSPQVFDGEISKQDIAELRFKFLRVMDNLQKGLPLSNESTDLEHQADMIVSYAVEGLLNNEVLSLDNVKNYFHQQLGALILLNSKYKNHPRYTTMVTELLDILERWDEDRFPAVDNLLTHLTGAKKHRHTAVCEADVRCILTLAEEPLIPSLDVTKYSEMCSRTDMAFELARRDRANKNTLELLGAGAIIAGYNAQKYCKNMFIDEFDPVAFDLEKQNMMNILASISDTPPMQ